MSSSGCPVWQRLNRAASRALALRVQRHVREAREIDIRVVEIPTETAAPRQPAARDCLALKWVSAEPLLSSVAFDTAKSRNRASEVAICRHCPNGNTLEINKKQNLS